MAITITNKMIKEMCGEISFKRGDSFYRANKVQIELSNTNEYQAIVKGAEDFHVAIKKGMKGEIHANCSCPKLASFTKDCQHIAATLLAIMNHHISIPLDSNKSESHNLALNDDLLTLFQQKSDRSSGHQSHFETRKILDVEFTCKPVQKDDTEILLAIELVVAGIKVKNIREFLDNVNNGKKHVISEAFTYDKRIHCFSKETNDIILKLIEVFQNERVYSKTINTEEKASIQIPPSSWQAFVPLLLKAPLVKQEYHNTTYQGLQISNGKLPLKIDFHPSLDKHFQLEVKGFQGMILLNSYHSVLSHGILYQLEVRDSKRLNELIGMINRSTTNSIPILQEQIGFFLEKVIPGLKKLGDVTIADEISQQLVITPLKAKLYLDRLKNRLLAGLEFHYEEIVISPLENKENQSNMFLVRDVNQETKILELMDEIPFTKTDGGYFLQNEELEYRFLTHVLPKLQKHMQIYATTAIRNRIFRGNVRPQIRVKVKKERTNWLEFKFDIDGIPNDEIKDILAALEEKRKYYRLRNGSLLSLETSEIEEIQRFLQSPQVENKDILNGLDLPIEQSLQLLDTVEGSSAFMLEPSFQQFLDTIRNPGHLQFEVPKSMAPILKDYQKLGFQWMKTLAYYGFGGILADDMGLGKTIQSISFIRSELSNIRKQKQPVLIVCPSSLTYNWLSECMKFAPEIEALVIDGTKAERENLQRELHGIDVVISSYPLVRRDIKWFEQQQFHTIFFDEAQAFKNPVTQTARAVKKLKADYRFALTGTPVENSSEEIWSIFHVVFPTLFLGLKDFSKLSRKTISKRIQPFLLRRMKEDVLKEFPEKRELLEISELHPEQKKLYAAYLAKLRHDTLKHLDKETIYKNRIKILAGLTRLRQICCHPQLFIDGYSGSSGKFEQLMTIIHEAKHSGRRVLLFSQFTKMLSLIGKELTSEGLSFFYLDGQTPSDERVELCNRYNSGERDFFLISLKAGGTGLNLMSADTVILYDTWWNPAVEEQAADRAHRIGQKNDVQVIKLITRGTIEEKINALQDKKKMLVDEIINPDDGIKSTLTEDDLKELFM
ncbi:DEAD/DEAH box helicase [Metabacillus litoralis]|uniref:DEAD/DEAH box helicase n=1 Tax=Metabacillus litoralis TaxID=152268 RepID=UPI001CFE65FD|nr:DEAD/DEAH box helicase [Metabacillus litoralis]